MTELLHKAISDRILAAFYQVHSELGPGYLESVYVKAMEIAPTEDGLGVERDVAVSVYFRGQRVGAFRADMIVESVVLLEFKAGDRLDPAPSRSFSIAYGGRNSNLVHSAFWSESVVHSPHHDERPKAPSVIVR